MFFLNNGYLQLDTVVFVFTVGLFTIMFCFFLCAKKPCNVFRLKGNGAYTDQSAPELRKHLYNV